MNTSRWNSFRNEVREMSREVLPEWGLVIAPCCLLGIGFAVSTYPEARLIWTIPLGALGGLALSAIALVVMGLAGGE